MKGKIADGEARDRLIIWIQRRMAEFGITVEALAVSLQEDQTHPPLFRDARGNEWNGVGDMPDWLRAATHAGVNPDFFQVGGEEAAKPRSDTRDTKGVAPQFDLFA